MARRKRDHFSVIEAHLSPKAEPKKKPRYKQYWVDLVSSRGEVFMSTTLPPDAPVRKGYSSNKTLATISECEIWDEIEFFHSGQWVELRLREASKRLVIHVDVTFSEETSEDPNKVLEKVRQRYGSQAKVSLVETQVMAELADD